MDSMAAQHFRLGWGFLPGPLRLLMLPSEQLSSETLEAKGDAKETTVTKVTENVEEVPSVEWIQNFLQVRNQMLSCDFGHEIWWYELFWRRVSDKTFLSSEEWKSRRFWQKKLLGTKEEAREDKISWADAFGGKHFGAAASWQDDVMVWDLPWFGLRTHLQNLHVFFLIRNHALFKNPILKGPRIDFNNTFPGYYLILVSSPHHFPGFHMLSPFFTFWMQLS